MNRVSLFFKNLIDLEDGLDREGAIYEIKNNKRMQGANAWMLMCSIVIASLGLDLNSPAVIIGAMLISPLMAPILGVGLGVGIADTATIRISLQHFGIAISIALFTSTIYFMITPFGELTTEILNRTSPTLLDVLVAFFGGVAGIISSSRKDKSNAIPGVAIATALMPPLCVTGFGIATGNWQVMLNSFYLFFLNSFFVAMATYFIVRYLRFPRFKPKEPRDRNRAIFFVFLLSFILIIPSVLILRTMYNEIQQKRNASNFIAEYFGDRKKFIDGWEIFEGEPNRLMIKVYGNTINYNDTIASKPFMEANHLENTKLEILQTSEIDLEKIEKLSAEVKGISKMNEQLVEAKKVRSVQEIQIDSLSAELTKIASDSFVFQQVKDEIKVLFPDLEYFGVGHADVTDFDTSSGKAPFIVVQWKPQTSSRILNENEEKITSYVKMRMKKQEILLVRR
jgi:uncharacterized hydrophobic protein (TIGR00271 family)